MSSHQNVIRNLEERFKKRGRAEKMQTNAINMYLFSAFLCLQEKERFYKNKYNAVIVFVA